MAQLKTLLHCPLRALAVLSVLSAFLAVSCIDRFVGNSEDDDEGDGEGSARGSEYRELRDERRDLERRVAELREAGQRREELVQEELAAVAALDEVRGYERKLRSLHEEATAQLQTWREATRRSFVGVQLPEIETIDGAKWTAVTIRHVGDDAIQIEHAGGTAEIEILRLPLGLRKNLIHEPTALAERDS